ncbi:MAG: mannose-1-phosphate guanylyltransferase [Gammaproteobacteria bacterium]|nr:MAG: mannose-1-phosphate guanylyltransferase [Gammaproteobacteria bacterium]TND07041.1 MAG: mannose-1-phosphate guanylyltransferase [Gammaproteobacteria bacterium]
MGFPAKYHPLKTIRESLIKLIIQPVILSGGSGSRLWPLSREHYPKQLLSLLGDHSLLQATVQRLDDLSSVKGSFANVAGPLLVCNEEHRFLVAEQIRQLGRESAGIILEPVGRNTAPALTLAAHMVNELHSDAVMLVMPADHVIKNPAAFSEVVRQGAVLAEQGCLVTFGITPGAPETGYGYIKQGARIEPAAAGCYVDTFVEKPDAETARQYVASGQFLWNSGIFMMKSSTWLTAISRYRPDIAKAAAAAYASGSRDQDFYRVNPDAFRACPSDSVDYAVMEKAASDDGNGRARAVVFPLDAGWSDIGAWSALWEVSAQDENGNVIKGDVYAFNSKNSLLIAENRLLAGIGLEDMIVIETGDAVMVLHKSHAQDVKHVVERLKNDKRTEHMFHRRVYRPWGSYEGIDSGDRFQVKRIVVKPGASLSLQMHHHRAEHWIVVKGTARVTRGQEEFLLSENESTYIPIGVTHRLANPGTLLLELIEVQSGGYLGEDDIVRFDDIYGRKS